MLIGPIFHHEIIMEKPAEDVEDDEGEDVGDQGVFCVRCQHFFIKSTRHRHGQIRTVSILGQPCVTGMAKILRRLQ